MAKVFHPRILTANDLIEGVTVFLGAEGWNPRIDRALVAVTPEQAEELEALGLRHSDQHTVIGPYLIEVEIGTDGPVPLLRREQIRASGEPTIEIGFAPLSHAA